MALLLRKACQEILDHEDLNAFHADIHTTTKQLTLFTVCGKPFAPVHGVRFGKMSPTKAEIDFATELLSSWLHRNQLAIDTYIDGLEKLQLLGKPAIEIDIDNANIQITTASSCVRNLLTNTYDTILMPTGFNLNYNDNVFKFNADGLLMSVVFSKGVEGSWTTAMKIPAKILNAAQNHLYDRIVYGKLENSVNLVLSELNSCTD